MNELRGMIYTRFKTEADCARQLGWPKQKLNYITNGNGCQTLRTRSSWPTHCRLMWAHSSLFFGERVN